jgi:hypothetical protein
MLPDKQKENKNMYSDATILEKPGKGQRIKTTAFLSVTLTLFGYLHLSLLSLAFELRQEIDYYCGKSGDFP